MAGKGRLVRLVCADSLQYCLSLVIRVGLAWEKGRGQPGKGSLHLAFRQIVRAHRALPVATFSQFPLAPNKPVPKCLFEGGIL